MTWCLLLVNLLSLESTRQGRSSMKSKRLSGFESLVSKGWEALHRQEICQDYPENPAILKHVT